MIASFRVGLHHDVSLGEHRLGLVKQHVKCMERNAQRVSRQMFKTCQGRVAAGMSPVDVAGETTLVTLAKQYGCVPGLVPYAVTCFRELVAAKSLQ
jgi:hypothetical protein